MRKRLLSLMSTLLVFTIFCTVTNFTDAATAATYGDINVSFEANGTYSKNYKVWDGGAYGLVQMTIDTYSNDALKITSKGQRPGGDPYTAVTIADGIRFDWSSGKGITFWARNDADKEVSFNVEFDVRRPSDGDLKWYRFNVRQGQRFWLYDLNTKEQTIYMTRPAITIPPQFEGWVRVPFEAYKQADWSIDQVGALPRSDFMAEGTWVSYVCVTVYSVAYKDMTFAINKIGCYNENPHFVSDLVPAGGNRKSIGMLIGHS